MDLRTAGLGLKGVASLRSEFQKATGITKMGLADFVMNSDRVTELTDSVGTKLSGGFIPGVK